MIDTNVYVNVVILLRQKYKSLLNGDQGAKQEFACAPRERDWTSDSETKERPMANAAVRQIGV